MFKLFSMKSEESIKNKRTLDDRAQELARYLLVLRRMQNKEEMDFLLSIGNLSLPQLKVLNTIGDRGSCTMSEIAKEANLSLSSITLIVDKLVKLKLVVRLRTEADRRIVYAKLTPQGQKIYQVQLDHIQSIVRKMLGALSSEEQESFLNIFQKIAFAQK